MRSKFDVVAMLRFRRLLRRLAPDVFHANLPAMWSGQYALAMALLLGWHRPSCVVVEHSTAVPESGPTLWLKRWTSARLTAHVAVAEDAARRVESIVGLATGSIQVIPVGVPERAEVPPRLAGGPLTVGVVGRLDPDKRVGTAIAALAQVPCTQLVIVGDGPDRAALEAAAAAGSVAGRVRFEGWVEEPAPLVATGSSQ